MSRTGPLGRVLHRLAGFADAALFAAAFGMIWGVIALHLWGEYDRTIADARQDSTNLARAFAESSLRTVREIDQTLLYVRALHLRDGDGLDLRPWVDSSAMAHGLAFQVAISGRNGLVKLSNLRPVTERIDLSDRQHFRHFADHPVDDLYVSVPVVGRLSHHQSIQFTRMLTTPQGAFDGIVVVSVDPDYLVQFYRSVDVGAGGRVTLTGLDGVIRADAGSDRPIIGNRSASPAIARAAAEPEGDFDWTDPVDGVRRLTHFRRVEGTALVVEVGLSTNTVTKAFRADLRANLIGGPLLSLVVGSIGLIARRHRQRLTLAQRTMNAAVENISQGLIMVDRTGRMALINRRARELLDVPEEVQPGDTFQSPANWQSESGASEPGMLPDIGQRIEDDPRAELSLSDHFIRTRPNGTVLEVRTRILPHGEAVRTFTDVTAWEQTQAALTAARDAAEAGLRARAQFLAVMSHEIRTPLNGVLGVADLLRATALSAEQERYVRIVQDSGRHLLDLVNDILDFSCIDQGRTKLETIMFEPRSVLADVLAMFAAHADERGLRLSSVVDKAVPARVLGDPYRFRQVLLNLVGNAVKFTERGSIAVNVAASRIDDAPEPGAWRLFCRVRDSGIGMSADVTQQLFQEFTQIDGSITRRFGGTGLGLAISRRLVEAMGGTISLESTPGVGSIFTFDIRVGAVAEQDATAAAAVGMPVLPPLSVLLAEDNRVNRIVATSMLEKLGCRVAMAEDGGQAVQQVQQGRYDLVLMDVMMPHMDGLAATRAIRSLPGPERRIAIIGLTANAFPSDAEACIEAGMDGFLAKPVTLDHLGAAIASVLHLPRAAVTAPAGSKGPDVLAQLTVMLGEATVADMVAAFRQALPGQLAAMHDQAATGDAGGVACTAHALAGSASTVGCSELAAAARALEQASRAQTVDDLAVHLDRIDALAHLALGAVLVL